MSWYALQVLTGREQDVAEMLRRTRIQAIAPEEQVFERRGGEWHTVRKTLLPGYVLIHVDMTVRLYDNLTHKPYVLALIGSAGDRFAPIPDDQIQALLPGGDPLWGCSRGRRGEDGKIEILGGPLHGIDAARIIKIDAHRRRATLGIQLYDTTYTTDVAIILDDDTDAPDTDATDDKQP